MQLSSTLHMCMEHQATGFNVFFQSQVEQMSLIQNSKQIHLRHLLHLQLLGKTQVIASIT